MPEGHLVEISPAIELIAHARLAFAACVPASVPPSVAGRETLYPLEMLHAPGALLLLAGPMRVAGCCSSDYRPTLFCLWPLPPLDSRRSRYASLSPRWPPLYHSMPAAAQAASARKGILPCAGQALLPERRGHRWGPHVFLAALLPTTVEHRADARGVARRGPPRRRNRTRPRPRPRPQGGSGVRPRRLDPPPRARRRRPMDRPRQC